MGNCFVPAKGTHQVACTATKTVLILPFFVYFPKLGELGIEGTVSSLPRVLISWLLWLPRQFLFYPFMIYFSIWGELGIEGTVSSLPRVLISWLLWLPRQFLFYPFMIYFSIGGNWG